MNEDDRRRSDPLHDFVPTGISKAYWYEPAGEGSFSEASIPAPGSHHPEVACWLDRLLEGGLKLPTKLPGSSPAQALSLLLTGPPGTGKSTLSLELCYRWALNADYNSLYVTTEAPADRLINNVDDFFGQDAAAKFQQASRDSPRSAVTVLPLRSGDDLRTLLDGPTVTQYILDIARLLGYDVTRHPNLSSPQSPFDLIVIDSLNTVREPTSIGTQKISNLFRDLFVRITESGARVVLFILDSTPNAEKSEFWEYSSDVVIRLNRTYPTVPSDYMLRTIEIIKARYQSHVWGPHQLKIYKGRFAQDRPNADASHLRRAYPFRTEGGIFIYPSIHYILSTYKRSDPFESPRYVRSPIVRLTQLLSRGFTGGQHGGLPVGRCTAFLGIRGGHKSHLGFMQILSNIIYYEQRGLVISLRDDVGVTRTTMERILQAWRRRDVKLDVLERADQLEIMYYAPGYITPDEFLHRILLSVQRMKQKGQSDLCLLFNSLDQLDARFPLCARESIFIPGLIQMLSAEGVTSIFIAASEPGEYSQHGLDSIAELILHFTHAQDFTREKYCEVLQAALPTETEKISAAVGRLPDKPSLVQLEVTRFAGGRAAGAKGVLDLIEEGHPLQEIGSEAGLVFFPITS
jgi:KaiC/GvpD/RAD55 family RecA-like ATPase